MSLNKEEGKMEQRKRLKMSVKSARMREPSTIAKTAPIGTAGASMGM